MSTIWIWPLVAFVIGLLVLPVYTFVLAVTLFGAIIVHELMHALVLKHYGVKYKFGVDNQGLYVEYDEGDVTLRQEKFMLLAGIVSGYVIVVIGSVLLWWPFIIGLVFLYTLGWASDYKRLREIEKEIR